MKIIVFLSLFFLMNTGSARDLVLLNEKGEVQDGYYHFILDLQVGQEGQLLKGEHIIIGDQKFTYQKVLGHGNTTLILEVTRPGEKSPYALRLPYFDPDSDFNIWDGVRFLNKYLDGYPILSEYEIAIPKIIESKRSAYILTELIPHDFDLEHFLENKANLGVVYEEGADALREFARETAIFKSIGDFHYQQLVYNIQKRKWTLLDWSTGTEIAESINAPVIFKKIPALQEITKKERYLITDIDRFWLKKYAQDLKSAKDSKSFMKIIESIDQYHLGFFFRSMASQVLEENSEFILSASFKFSDFGKIVDKLKVSGGESFVALLRLFKSRMSEINHIKEVYNLALRNRLAVEDAKDISIIFREKLNDFLQKTLLTAEDRTFLIKLEQDFNFTDYQLRSLIRESLEDQLNCYSIMANLIHGIK